MTPLCPYRKVPGEIRGLAPQRGFGYMPALRNVRPSLAEEGHVISLDIDPKTHPAWTGGTAQALDRGGRLSRFKDKFKGFVKS